MSTTLQESPPLRIPEIPLKDLPEGTKDFLLALIISGKSFDEAVRGTLNEAAAERGFNPTQP